jgi:acyl-[acyl-carrier-protein]-phospholipid O-acyltransferase / long-chain-fatty-acid--[acyl-carrier-protein] ligase
MAGVSFAERLLRWSGLGVASLFYRVRPLPSPQLPEGGCLLLPNHVTWVDSILLQLATPRRIRFLANETHFHNRWLAPWLVLFGAIPVSPRRAKTGIRAAVRALQNGEVVCLFPEGTLTRTGRLIRLQRGFGVIAERAGVPCVPVWVDGAWGSVFSFSEGRYFFKRPLAFPYPVQVAFGEPVSPESVSHGGLRERLLDLGERCYQERPFLEGHLGRAAIRGLRRDPRAVAVYDGMDGSELRAGNLLAASLALASVLRAHCPEARVAVVLPPGKGATVANLAVVLAGKVPVNLNFTAGKAALTAACRIAGVRSVLTAGAFMARLPDFPWPEHRLLLEQLLPAIKTRAVLWRLACAFLPSDWIASLARVPDRGDRSEAVLLFTSGSAGDPKGVVLTHRNLLGNVSQFSAMLGLRRGDAILACLPVFHSFGSTVNLWFPLIEGLRMVTYPSPLDIPKNAELVERQHVKLLCSTPTFLRGYLRKATPKQLASVELLITGAEKLPVDLANAFEAQFQIPVLQGYGLTETSPVVSVNLPDPPPADASSAPQPSSRKGSVGLLAPGLTARIRDPETGAPLPLEATGMLWLKGVNVFEGYLDDPARTAQVLQDGWFATGDLARFDEDGFLYIEGRLSRFSKIGGEMVPHETVEAAVRRCLGIEGEDLTVTVTGVPDAAKGEALVLLSTRELEFPRLRRELSAAGIPNLWIPRQWVHCPEIPQLASGKLDLRRIQQLALLSLE